MNSELLMVVVTLVPSKLLYLASTEALFGANAYCPAPAVSIGKKYLQLSAVPPAISTGTELLLTLSTSVITDEAVVPTCSK